MRAVPAHERRAGAAPRAVPRHLARGRHARDAARARGGAGRGRATALVTANADGGIADVADRVLVTPFTDCAWCHTVGYTTALLAGAAIARELGLERIDADAAAALLGAARRGPEAAEMAAALAGARVILCAGAGTDHVTARELALKLAEGARMPTAGLELETRAARSAGRARAARDALLLVGFADDERVARRGALVRRGDAPDRAAHGGPPLPRPGGAHARRADRGRPARERGAAGARAHAGRAALRGRGAAGGDARARPRARRQPGSDPARGRAVPAPAAAAAEGDRAW